MSYCNAGSAFAAGALLNQGVLAIEDSVHAASQATATGNNHSLVEGAALTNSGTFRRSQFNPFPGQATLTLSHHLQDNIAQLPVSAPRCVAERSPTPITARPATGPPRSQELR